MLDFDQYVMRHGEFWVQAIIEQVERNEGVRARFNTTLEQRWDVVMNVPTAEQRLVA